MASVTRTDKQVPPPPAEYTIVLNQDEANALYALLNYGWGFWDKGLLDDLSRAGANGHDYVVREAGPPGDPSDVAARTFRVYKP